MDLSKLFYFSNLFSPPKTNLRTARISDDWGDDSNAKLEINHKSPDDVTIKELLYYPQGWAFMDIESVLFYAYAVFKFHDHPSEDGVWGAGVDFFFYTIDREIKKCLEIDQINILFDSIKEIWAEKPYFFDLVQCSNLQEALNIRASFEDEWKSYEN